MFSLFIRLAFMTLVFLRFVFMRFVFVFCLHAFCRYMFCCFMFCHWILWFPAVGAHRIPFCRGLYVPDLKYLDNIKSKGPVLDTQDKPLEQNNKYFYLFNLFYFYLYIMLHECRRSGWIRIILPDPNPTHYYGKFEFYNLF